jgi:predicted site-specific integrase-resolvase
MASLTAADVSADLHLSRATTTDYLRDGRIPGGFQPVPGGRWLVDEDTYRAWRADRKAAVDPHRIEPRSARSKAAQSRRRTA